jgi:type IV secretory pathway VirB10-like protein
MTTPSDTPEDVVKAMRLRPAPPEVMRLSRKAVWIGGGVAALAGSLIFAVALRAPSRATPPQDLYRPAAAPYEAVSALPKDYAGPRLGPPLPGDLGRPILAAGQADDWSPGDRVDAPSRPSQAETETAQADLRRREQATQARETALTSGLFLQAFRTPPATDGAASGGATPMASATASAAPALWPGVIIPGVLITGLRSDLPGAVLGQVAEDVRDSATGRRIVIPRGSRLIGAYDAEVAYGQSRLRIVWTRLVTPEGRSLGLTGAEASDPAGYAALEDQVDNRWGERLRTAGLTTLLSISTAATEGDDDDRIVRAVREGAGRSIDQVGRDGLNRGLAVPPRLTVRPGSPFHIILTDGLSLPSEGD